MDASVDGTALCGREGKGIGLLSSPFTKLTPQRHRPQSHPSVATDGPAAARPARAGACVCPGLSHPHRGRPYCELIKSKE